MSKTFLLFLCANNVIFFLMDYNEYFIVRRTHNDCARVTPMVRTSAPVLLETSNVGS